jgi:hypothetical protein
MQQLVILCPRCQVPTAGIWVFNICEIHFGEINLKDLKIKNFLIYSS